METNSNNASSSLVMGQLQVHIVVSIFAHFIYLLWNCARMHKHTCSHTNSRE